MAFTERMDILYLYDNKQIPLQLPKNKDLSAYIKVAAQGSIGFFPGSLFCKWTKVEFTFNEMRYIELSNLKAELVAIL